MSLRSIYRQSPVRPQQYYQNRPVRMCPRSLSSGILLTRTGSKLYREKRVIWDATLEYCLHWYTIALWWSEKRGNAVPNDLIEALLWSRVSAGSVSSLIQAPSPSCTVSFSVCFAFLFVTLDVRERGKSIVSSQKYCMIHVSSALIWELCLKSPRINHFRLSKQFAIMVSIFRFLYSGWEEKRVTCERAHFKGEAGGGKPDPIH